MRSAHFIYSDLKMHRQMGCGSILIRNASKLSKRRSPIPVRALTEASTVYLRPDSKITLAHSPLTRTRTAEEQSALEVYFKHISSSALTDCPQIENLLRATMEHPKAYTASPPDTVAIVQNIIRMSNAKRCIEVGVFTGTAARLKDLQILVLSESTC